jgi:ferritin-like protein
MSLHEAQESLRPETIDDHRGYRSLIEELEAIDWYSQRIDGADDPDLKAVLAHNREEEKEHACMVLEWLRRRDPELDRHLRTYLFAEGAIEEVEEGAEQQEAHDPPAEAEAAADGDLGVGSLRARGAG